MSLRIRLLASVLLATQAACAQDVRIGVLGLFRPHAVTVKAAPGQALFIQTKTIQRKTSKRSFRRTLPRQTIASYWSGVPEATLQR